MAKNIQELAEEIALLLDEGFIKTDGFTDAAPEVFIHLCPECKKENVHKSLYHLCVSCWGLFEKREKLKCLSEENREAIIKRINNDNTNKRK